MIIETKYGQFKLLKNYRDAFSKVEFEERYHPEVYDKFTFIVGDISADILRIKGFDINKRSPNFYRNIPIYLSESCNMNAAYYILERISDNNEKEKSSRKNPKKR